jgi:hypothetical protein
MTDILFNASRGSRILCADIVTFRSAYNSTFHILFFLPWKKVTIWILRVGASVVVAVF